MQQKQQGRNNRLWIGILVGCVVLLILLLVFSGALGYVLYLRNRGSGTDEFDVTKVLASCGKGCLVSLTPPKVQFRVTPTGNPVSTVTMKYKSFTWPIQVDRLSTDENDIRQSYTVLGNKLGAYSLSCRENTVCVLNLSHPSAQRLCYDYGKDVVFLVGPVDTPELSIAG